eukprot:2515326-Pleurochrysis_carterae.AAC.1
MGHVGRTLPRRGCALKFCCVKRCSNACALVRACEGVQAFGGEGEEAPRVRAAGAAISALLSFCVPKQWPVLVP